MTHTIDLRTGCIVRRQDEPAFDLTRAISKRKHEHKAALDQAASKRWSVRSVLARRK